VLFQEISCNGTDYQTHNNTRQIANIKSESKRKPLCQELRMKVYGTAYDGTRFGTKEDCMSAVL